MTRVKRAAAATLVSLVMAACADTTGPAPSDLNVGAAPSQALVVGNAVNTVYRYVLRHSPSAPALETYEASFYAIRGTNRSIEVRYQNGKDNMGTGDRFIRFTVPSGALVTDAAGNRLRKGDSVLVTLHIDATDFQVDFEPSGLSFARNAPAQLDVWYGNADPDANRDGIVDATDQYIFDNLLGMYHYDTKGSSAWTKVSSTNDASTKTVSSAIDGFSGYAVSW